MREVVIADAVRTPIGRFRGALSPVRADHLGAVVLQALLDRTGVSVQRIDDVIFGCVTQIGEQSGNIARTALLSAGWPDSIPGVTVDRKCGSAEAAIHMAYASIASGLADIVIAGGAESMTRVPMGSNRDLHGSQFGPILAGRYRLTSQGDAAERISDLWDLTAADHDAYAIESHRRAAAAASAGYFDNEIAPVDLGRWADQPGDHYGQVIREDETIRRETSMEKLSGLKKVFRENGRVSAGNASQICDGASAILLMSAATATQLGIRARARIATAVTVGSDPELMLTGPIAATRQLLKRAGLVADDVELFEVNEAFASVPLVWLRELGVQHGRLNVNGGAIALGHPLGASGARIMTTMLNELERRNGRYGLQSVCCAGGMATGTLIERLQS